MGSHSGWVQFKKVSADAESDPAGSQHPAQEHRQRPVLNDQRVRFGKVFFPRKNLMTAGLLSILIKYYSIFCPTIQSPGGEKRSITAPAVWIPSTAELMMPPA